MPLNLAQLQAIKHALENDYSKNRHLILAVKYEIDKRAVAAARLRNSFALPFDVEELEEVED